MTNIKRINDLVEWNKFIDWLKVSGNKYEVIKYPLFVKVMWKWRNVEEVRIFTLSPSTRRKPEIGNIMNTFKTITKFDSKLDKEKFGYKEIPIDKNHFKVKWDIITAYGFDLFDEYYARKPLKCWSYDINSAFAYAMLKPMPDTSQEPRYNDYIKQGEMGFWKLGGVATEIGVKADYVFKLVDSPFKEYIMKYYNLKKNATDKELRAKYKDFLNIPTGCMQKKDIFIRNAIIYWSNEYIKSFIDDNTVYCNVDCIVSLVPRYDIPIGEEIGQFKNEHVCEDFKYIQSGIYQWGKECHFKGIPGECLSDIEDISNWVEFVKYKALPDGKVTLNEKKKN